MKKNELTENKLKEHYKEEFSKLKNLKAVENSQLETKNFSYHKEWLEVLFVHYTERFKLDNERIWNVGAIFIPLSLAPFGVLVNSEKLHNWHFIILALISLVLILTWVIIAENQRGFQQKSETMLDIINEELGIQKIENESPKLYYNGVPKIVKAITIQQMRWILVLIIAMIWIPLIIMAFCTPSILGIKQLLY